MAERISDNIDLERVVWFLTAIAPNVGTGSQTPAPAPVLDGLILQENGFFILQEDSFYIQLEA